MKNKIKNKINIGLAACLLVTLCVIVRAYNKLQTLTHENQELISDNNALLQEYERTIAEGQKYKIQDSLNAITISELQVSLRTYKKLHEEDLAIIKASTIRPSEIEQITNTQTSTIQDIKAPVIKSDSLITFNYSSKWFDASGIIDSRLDTTSIHIVSRDELLAVEVVKYKRFLGFLWKTHKPKYRKIDIVSKNPFTKILNIEAFYITE